MRFGKLFVCLLPVLLLVSGAFAQNNVLPTVPENSPDIYYIHTTTSADGFYTAGTEVLTLSGSGSALYLPRATAFCNPAHTPSCPAPTVSVAIQVDNNGNLIGGNPTAGQPDLVVTGQATSGGVTYTSPLLTGKITEFFYDGVNNTPNFELRFAVTGGSMASLYLNPPSLNNDLWMTLNLETVSGTPGFTGSFATSFGGEIKGYIYSTPGKCFGTIGDFVWNDQNSNGIQDAGEPGLNGVTVNLYDSQNNLLETTVTAAGPTGSQLGYYQFTGVCAGTYTVKVDETTLPKGSNGKIDFAETTPNAPGSTTANDSNPIPSTVTLTTNASTDETIDFGYVSLQGAIGDYVWYDANDNGLQDAGETGINGVTVNLYDSTGTNLLATTTTAYGGPNNVNGYYQFTGLSAGNYIVAVDSTTLPPNYTPTTSSIGSNPAIDSNGSPTAVTLATDSSVDETIDFGYVSPCNGTIGDFVWHDLDLNGIQDTSEPGISGITLDLYNDSNTLLQTAITNGSGNYLFSGLCAGSYTVTVLGSTLPPNFTPTTSQAPGSTIANDSNGSPAPVVLTTDSSNNVVSNLTIDFGYVSPCNGAIGDFVWYDANGNGVQDAGELGIANVTVSLYNSQMTLLNATTTNGVGYYQFTGLCAGTYIVQVTPPAGYSATTVNAPGSTTANDSNPNPSTVVLSIIDNYGDITNDETIDFGFVLPAISVTCASVSAGEVGVPFDSGAMTVTGGLAPYTFSVVGTLPAGLTLNTSTGEVTGTPTATGSFTVQVADSVGNVGTGTCAIIIVAGPSLSCSSVTSGEVGVAFNSGAMTVTGGTSPYTFSVVGTLPAGLSLNASNGAVTGTATAAGSFTIKVVDSNGVAATGTCLITIIAGPSLSCSSVTSGEVGVAFNSGAMTVTGGTSPYTFSVVGTLPAGLTLNASNGAVTGTATAAGSFTIKVVDSNGVAATGTCLITIIAGPSLSCSSVTSGEVGVAFNSGAMTVTGGTSPYTFSVVGTLPAGLTLNASNGAVTGTATAAGSFSIKVVDSNGVAATGTCLITIIAGPSLSCSSVTSGEVGVAFNSGAMTVTGGTSPYTFSVVGTLPAGLSLNASTGAVTGTATAAGSFTIKVVDSNGVAATGTCLITIIAGPSLSCSSVTSGEVGVAFNSGAMTVTGGTAPYTFSVVGTLPAGLTLNASTGAVTGTATAAGSFSIKVVDSNGVAATGTCLITIIAGPSLSCSSVTSGEVGVAFNSGAMTVTGGTSPYTFSVVGTLPAGLTLNASNGAVTGTATAAGSFSIKVVDSNGVAATGTCLITIIAGPSLSCSSVTSGEVGVAFNSGAMTVTGGTSPYTFSVVGTLPAGLSLNASTGAVTGTATAAGSFSIKVVDSKGASATGTCLITIIAGPSLSCSSVTSGEVGVAFNSGAMTVTGGTSPYTFSVVGTLPAGLSLNASTGAVTGTATAAGSFSIKVVDSNGVAATGTCLITIIAGPSLSCSSVTSGEVGVAFNSGAMTVTGGTAPYTFSVVGTLPAGLSLNASNGAVTGTATAAGSFTIKVVDSNGVAATGTCLITIIAGPSLSCSSVTSGEVGVAFNSGAMTVTGGTSPYTFSVVGTLPAGLSLNASTGAVTGTATAAGSFSIKVVDSKGASATGTCLITIIAGPSPSCSSVTSGEVGVAFNSGAMTVTGGTAPYTFSVVGTLPAGLTLNASTGAVTGTATAAGSFTIKVVDSKGVSATGTCLITIIVGPTLSCSSVTSGEVGVAFNSGAMTVTGGTAPYTFSVVGTLPAGLTLNASTGAVTGTATAAGSFTIKVVDSKGVAATGTCLITIIAGPSLSCSSVTSGQVGVAFNSGVMTVTGGTSPYIFSVVGTLPAGLTLNTATGAVTGTATAAGSFSIKVTDAKGAISASTCTIAIAGTTGPSCVFGVASAYNLIALTGNISDSADITGRIAANGQVTQATTIGSGLKTGDTYLSLAKANGGPWAIVAAGGISTGGSFNINGGGNVYSSTATSANFNLANENYSGSAYAGSKLVIGGSSPINFTTLQTEMYALTKQLAGLTANGVVCSVNNSGLIIAGGGCPSSSKTYNPSWLVLYGTSTTTNIFNLTQAQFQGNNNLDIVVPTGSTVIVNVAGTSDTLNTSIYYNGATVADANASSILFNFASATTVTINAQFDAALLAPYAKLSGGSQMGGMFIAASIGSTGEVHYDAFMSSIPYSGTCSQ